MIPMRMSTVFKSRWMALLWAAGIVWCAVDYVGTGDDSSGAPGSAAKAQLPAGADTHLKDASGRPITAEELQELNGGGS
jgi:hypothetical protein